MRASNGKTFAAYLYREQQQRCYLRATEQCKTLDGYLHSDQLGKGACSPRGWTWEHVIPRWLSRELLKGASLRLLACAPCNQAKGDRLPTSDELRLAYEIGRGFSVGTPHGDIDELLRRYRERYSLSRAMVRAGDDPDVPATVEEALAQGGLKA